jgi:hypothetical protein
MIIPLSPAIATLLEKVAVDNGFDRELPRDGNWLAYASTQAPLRLWLSTFSDAVFIAAFSQANVARALAEHGSVVLSPLPTGAVAGRSVVDIPSLHRLVRRAFQLSRTLPDELLHAFAEKTAAMPRTTETERLVVQRVGQDIFRAGLLDYWDGRCAVTGLAVPELLRASHIKPWSKCEPTPSAWTYSTACCWLRIWTPRSTPGSSPWRMTARSSRRSGWRRRTGITWGWGCRCGSRGWRRGTEGIWRGIGTRSFSGDQGQAQECSSILSTSMKTWSSPKSQQSRS